MTVMQRTLWSSPLRRMRFCTVVRDSLCVLYVNLVMVVNLGCAHILCMCVPYTCMFHSLPVTESEEPDWLKASRADGRKGLVPANYVEMLP